MTWVEIVALAIFLFSIFLGWRMGLILALTYLCAGLAGGYVVNNYGNEIISYLDFLPEAFQGYGLIVVIYGVVFLLFGLLGRLLRSLSRFLLLGFLDRLGGILLGTLLGMVITVLFVSLLSLSPLAPSDSWLLHHISEYREKLPSWGKQFLSLPADWNFQRD